MGEDNRKQVATIVTPRLRLRAFEERDREGLLALQMDPQTMATYGGGVTLSAEEAEKVLQYHIDCRAYPYWAWAVTIGDEDVCMGQMTAGWVDWRADKWIEMGWIVRREFWGRGFGTEALAAMIAHGEEKVGWERVMADAWPTNKASRRIMEKVGMVYVGDEMGNRGMRSVYVTPRSLAAARGDFLPERKG